MTSKWGIEIAKTEHGWSAKAFSEQEAQAKEKRHVSKTLAIVVSTLVVTIKHFFE